VLMSQRVVTWRRVADGDGVTTDLVNFTQRDSWGLRG
jgi:hypothetical protein